MAEEFKIAQPLEYYRTFLEKEVRPDGRELGEVRPIVLNIGCVTTAEGSALVKMGNTAVMCGIKAELAEPKTEEPNWGFIVPNLELSPICSPLFKPGPPGEDAQVYSQLLLDIISNSKCIHKEDLCIMPGKLAWVLYCDLMCLDHDGNMLDAALLALITALCNTCLPIVEIDEDTESININFKKTKSLQVYSHPVSTTFSIFDGHIILVDPRMEEENLASGIFTIAVTKDKICAVIKPGGSAITESQLQMCISRAFKRSGGVRDLVKKTLESNKN